MPKGTITYKANKSIKYYSDQNCKEYVSVITKGTTFTVNINSSASLGLKIIEVSIAIKDAVGKYVKLMDISSTANATKVSNTIIPDIIQDGKNIFEIKADILYYSSANVTDVGDYAGILKEGDTVEVFSDGKSADYVLISDSNVEKAVGKYIFYSAFTNLTRTDSIKIQETYYTLGKNINYYSDKNTNNKAGVLKSGIKFTATPYTGESRISVLQITECSKKKAVGKYIRSSEVNNDGESVGVVYITKNGIEYYSSTVFNNYTYEGILPSGTHLKLASTTINGSTSMNVMYIIGCSKKEAIGCYISYSQYFNNGSMADKIETDFKTNIYYTITDEIPYYSDTNTDTLLGTLKVGDTIETIPSKNPAYVIISDSSNSNAVGKYILIGNLKDKYKNIYVKEAKTTTDENTGETTPENTDSNDNTSGSDTTIVAEAMYIDDAFIDTEYSKVYKSNEEYYDNLQNGLRVQDLRGILGMPHQFLPIADPRIDSNTGAGDDDGFGRVYSEKIIKHIPLLLMTPGVPTFMAGYKKEQKDKIVAKLADLTSETLESIFGTDRIGKYYSLKYAYTEYFYYVNAMLRSAAHFLDIQGEKIDGKRLGNHNWLYHTSTMGSEIFGHGKLANFLGPYAGCIAFYADAGTSTDDSFSNSTTESSLSSSLNSLSDKGRELNFLIGNVGGLAGVNLDLLGAGDNLDAKIDGISGKIDKLLGEGNVLSNILGKGVTILAGGRVIFPEIWSDSSFSRSYSCTMKLVSPSGDKLSVFLNILVPIYHLLAFTLPREADNQAYFSPFLVRAYYKGLFNVDMGIIPGLSITKGDEGEWTIDGIPTVANISFEIRDLYSGLYMSKQTNEKDRGIMSNIQELDYIANSCGINVNDQEIMRTIRMHIALGFSTVTDKVTIGIFGNVAQYFNQKMQNIFGVFK